MVERLLARDINNSLDGIKRATGIVGHCDEFETPQGDSFKVEVTPDGLHAFSLTQTETSQTVTEIHIVPHAAARRQLKSVGYKRSIFFGETENVLEFEAEFPNLRVSQLWRVAADMREARKATERYGGWAKIVRLAVSIPFVDPSELE